MHKKFHDLMIFSKSLRVLLVEDNTESREQAEKLLQNLFADITIAYDGVDGLQKFKSKRFDLIVSDIIMPNMNGIEMIKNIKEINNDIPVIIITAYNDTRFFMDTIKLGVNGYILKPINFKDLMSTLYTTVEKIKLRYEVERYKKELENMVQKRTVEIVALNKEITETQREVVFTMGAIGENRSKETGNHVKRVALYSKVLALYYGMSEDEAQLLKDVSPMHDIGKVAIPDAILNKPALFNKEERSIMEQHASIGRDMLMKSKRPLLKLASIVAYQHHEKYDGTGYPQGLKGEEIDIHGRITALADVFDALSNTRVYKEAWSDEKIFTMLKQERGKHFDPVLVDLFFKHQDEFLQIRSRLKD